MSTNYYTVCSIRMSGESSSGIPSAGLLVYVYHITDETNAPHFMDFIDACVQDCAGKTCQCMPLTKESFEDKASLMQVWGKYLDQQSLELLMTPDVDFGELQAAGIRQVYYHEKISPMPAIPVKIYMEHVGSKDDRFSPFNRLELRYPLSLKKDDKEWLESFFTCFNNGLVKRLSEL